MTRSGSYFQCHALNSSLLSGHDSRDSTSSEQPVPQFSDAADGANVSLAGKRIAVISEVLGEGVSDAVHKVLDEAIDHFKSLGASVEMVGLLSAWINWVGTVLSCYSCNYVFHSPVCFQLGTRPHCSATLEGVSANFPRAGVIHFWGNYFRAAIPFFCKHALGGRSFLLT